MNNPCNRPKFNKSGLKDANFAYFVVAISAKFRILCFRRHRKTMLLNEICVKHAPGLRFHRLYITDILNTSQKDHNLKPLMTKRRHLVRCFCADNIYYILPGDLNLRPNKYMGASTIPLCNIYPSHPSYFL